MATSLTKILSEVSDGEVRDVADFAQVQHDAHVTFAERELCDKVAALNKPNGVFECTDCGNMISPDRKKACPGAIRCVSCETKHETRRHFRRY